MTHSRTRRWATRAAGLTIALSAGGAAVTGVAAAQPPESAAPPPPVASSAAPAVASDAADVAGDTADTADTAGDATGQSDPHEGDLLVPDWLLLVIAIALVVGAVSLATQSYLRFSRTRRELEG